MRFKIIYSACLLVVIMAFVSCQDKIVKGNYKENYTTLYSFLEENEEYSDFKSIVDAAKIDGTEQNMSIIYGAFNHNSPVGTNFGYTLFLPDNEAVQDFLVENNVTLSTLLSNPDDCWRLAAHHLLVRKTLRRNFINGALGDSSLNGEFHTIRFEDTETGVSYLVDQIATVKFTDIEQSNGVIHIIDKVLQPLSETSCEWLSQEPDYSIFFEGLELTGLYDSLQSINTRLNPFTMFVESNTVFAQKNIFTLDDLINFIAPDDVDYKNQDNAVYQFFGYHVLPERVSYSDLTPSSSENTDGTEVIDRVTKRNYNTLAYYPLQISLDENLSLREGLFEQVGINTAFAIYDTIISTDTLIVDHISIFEEPSNLPTLSGVMHFINYVMPVDETIKPASSTFHFREDPNINAKFNTIIGSSYFYEDELERFKFEGDLNYLIYYWTDESIGANNNDYINFYGGNFTFTYRTTPMLQGDYTARVKMKVDDSYGLFDFYVDGVKVGNTINLASKSPNTLGYASFDIGKVYLGGYKEREITIKSVTPCRIYWDFIQFNP